MSWDRNSKRKHCINTRFMNDNFFFSFASVCRYNVYVCMGCNEMGYECDRVDKDREWRYWATHKHTQQKKNTKYEIALWSVIPQRTSAPSMQWYVFITAWWNNFIDSHLCELKGTLECRRHNNRTRTRCDFAEALAPSFILNTWTA